jgi:hypothetical protein
MTHAAAEGIEVHTGDLLDGGEPAVTLYVEWSGGNGSEAITGRLLSVTRRAMKLSVTAPLPLHQTETLRLKIPQLHLDLAVSTDICWLRPASDSSWEFGCAFDPELPRDSLKDLHDREHSKLPVPAVQQGSIPASARWASETGSFKVRFEDFSTKGVRFASAQPAKVGEQLELEFDRPNGTSCAIWTRCQWQLKCADRYRIACSLENAADFDRLCAVTRAAHEIASPFASPRGDSLWARKVRWLRLGGFLLLTVVCAAVLATFLFQAGWRVPPAMRVKNRALTEPRSTPTASPPAQASAAEMLAGRRELEVLAAKLREHEAAIQQKQVQLNEQKQRFEKEVKEREADVTARVRQLERATDQLAKQRKQLQREQEAWNQSLRQQKAQVENQQKESQGGPEPVDTRELPKHGDTSAQHASSVTPPKPDPSAAQEISPSASAPPMTADPATVDPATVDVAAVNPSAVDPSAVDSTPTADEAPATVRRWVDSTRRYNVEAVLLEYSSGIVRLKKADGSITSVPFAKLSAEDQEFLSKRKPAHDP